MPNFSQRMGLKPIEKMVQLASLDEETRNRLWSAVHQTVWGQRFRHENDVYMVVGLVWRDFLKRATDTHTDTAARILIVREYFFRCTWGEVFDFLEFTLENLHGGSYPQAHWKEALAEQVGKILKEENSAYRLFRHEFVEITNEGELKEIEQAGTVMDGGVSKHIHQAAAHLWNRKNPDYRNSIKESISAIESLCRSLTGNPHATLGACLGLLDKKAPMHVTFKDALHKLYGYTSNEGGVRHGLIDGARIPTFAEAKFMLVTCSAFVNFLKEAYPNK